MSFTKDIPLFKNIACKQKKERRTRDMLKVVNPINRTPEELNTEAHACVCYTGTGYDGAKIWADLPVTTDCGCNCSSDTDNNNANFQLAFDIEY